MYRKKLLENLIKLMTTEYILFAVWTEAETVRLSDRVSFWEINHSCGNWCGCSWTGSVNLLISFLFLKCLDYIMLFLFFFRKFFIQL